MILVLANKFRVIVVTNGMQRGCCRQDCRACAWGMRSSVWIWWSTDWKILFIRKETMLSGFLTLCSSTYRGFYI